MKDIPAALLEYYGTGNTEIAYAILIEKYGPHEEAITYYPDPSYPQLQMFGFTSHDTSFSMNLRPWGFIDSSDLVSDLIFTFDSAQGFEVSSIVSSSGLGVDNLEITTLDDGSFFKREEIIAGAWNKTYVRIFRYRTDVNPPTIENDVEVLFSGHFGEIKLTQNYITIELRSLKQLLQQTIGEVSSKTCRWQFPQCFADQTAWEFPYTVTSVSSKKVFTASGATEASDYYGDGIVTFTSGKNKNLSQKVSTFSGGTFNLLLPMLLDIQVGDTFTAIPGCRKRLIEDCKTKFNNVYQYRGEPYRPTPDRIMA